VTDDWRWRTNGDPRRDRGQLVLVAAAALAIALAPLVLAYLQLGYHADVQAATDYDAPAENAQRLLERAVHESTGGIPTDYDWTDRGDAVDAVHSRLDPIRSRLATARVESGTAYRTSYNQTSARAWASDHCPSGPDRQFGGCEARRGVVVQNRAGRTHVLAVALDLTVTTDRGTRRLTLLGGPDRD
jgi:hypothetical protein